MKNNRPLRVCLWLRVSTDSKGQDPGLQRADLEAVCEHTDGRSGSRMADAIRKLLPEQARMRSLDA